MGLLTEVFHNLDRKIGWAKKRKTNLGSMSWSLFSAIFDNFLPEKLLFLKNQCCDVSSKNAIFAEIF
jgi:hypothetical protein